MKPFTNAILWAFIILAAACLSAASSTAAPPEPRVFGPSKIQEIYRLLLHRDALLLESIVDTIKKKDIRDGEVLITAGSLQEFTFHYVTSTAPKPKDEFKTVKGNFEILSGGGIIADGVPHIHIALSSGGTASYGGHLENGSRVLYLAEVTIIKYDGPALTRTSNQNGVMLLRAK
jgi:uncharacterized protein